jgi:hypothetical protein
MRTKGMLRQAGYEADREDGPPPASWTAPAAAAELASRSVPMSFSVVARVTMRPVEIDRRSAGIWLTRPSPTDNNEYV